MAKPNIAILHYAAPPTIGGVEATIAAHARLFADHGYSVRVIAGSGKNFDPRVPVDIIPDAGSRSRRVEEVNSELASGITCGAEALAGELTLELEDAFRGESKPVYVIAHNILSLHKNLALTIATKNLLDRGHIKLIAWCHDFAWTDPQYARDVHAGFPWDLLRTPWGGVEYVVVSEARKRELQALWSSPAEIVIVPPGIDLFGFLGIAPVTTELVRAHGLLDADPLLLLPARLTRRKRIEYALEITAALRAQGMNAKLVVTGPPGPHNPTNTAYLESLREQRARLHLDHAAVFLHESGHVPDQVMRDLFLVSDALLFPSEREGFGIPLLEAGLARLPIFCSDLEPLRETARENAHYLVPGQAAESAAEEIAKTLSQDPAYRQRHRVVSQYAWENVFKERIEPLLH